MSLNSFYVYILVLTMGLMQAYSFFKTHFSGVEELRERVAQLERQVEQEKVKTQVAYHEAEVIRQDIAALLPDKIRSHKESYQVRSLASVLQVQEPLDIDSSKTYLQKGKELFSKHKYKEAIVTFKALIEKFPDSTNVIESYFLLSESYYQLGDLEDTIDTVETLIALFPESELTGFALLRLSGIYIERQFKEDAKEILLTVRHNFSFNAELQEQATQLLKRVE